MEEQLKSLRDENLNYRDFLNEIKWLKRTILFVKMVDVYTSDEKGALVCYENKRPYQFSENALDHYKTIIIILKNIYNKCLTIKENLVFEYPLFLEYPEVVFDKIFFADNYDLSKSYDFDMAITVCEFFDYMTYLIVNRIDELEFDLQG